MYYWFGDEQQKLNIKKGNKEYITNKHNCPIREGQYSEKEKQEFLDNFYKKRERNKKQTIILITLIIIGAGIMITILFI